MEIYTEIPAVLRFDRETTYTFRRGPNAGRAVKYIGPAGKPFEDCVKVETADKLPFSANTGRKEGISIAVCLPDDLVVK